MTTLKFYFPSNDDGDQDEFMQSVWEQGIMSYLIFTQRVSLRGNPYIKGVFVLNDGAIAPLEFECIPLPHDHALSLIESFREEISIKANDLELGRIY